MEHQPSPERPTVQERSASSPEPEPTTQNGTSDSCRSTHQPMEQSQISNNTPSSSTSSRRSTSPSRDSGGFQVSPSRDQKGVFWALTIVDANMSKDRFKELSRSGPFCPSSMVISESHIASDNQHGGCLNQMHFNVFVGQTWSKPMETTPSTRQ